MKKDTIYKIIKFVTFPILVLLLVILIINFLSFNFNSDAIKMKMIYNEQNESIDAIYLGPSTVKAGLLPTQIYKEFGFTSYNYSMDSMPIELVKFIIEELNRVQKPKLFVLDLNNLTYADNKNNDGAIKKFITGLPEGEVKNKVIEALIPEAQRKNYKNKLLSNHSNWKVLPEILASRNLHSENTKSVMKGFATRYSTFVPTKAQEIISVKNYGKEKALSTLRENQLKDLLEFIQDNNINILFIKTPRYTFADTIYETEMLNYAEHIVTSFGYEFINFDKTILDLNLKVEDFCDAFHLNNLGAIKFSSYFGNLINNKYNLKGNYSTDITTSWDKAITNAEVVLNYMGEKFKTHKNDKTYIDENFIRTKKFLKHNHIDFQK